MASMDECGWGSRAAKQLVATLLPTGCKGTKYGAAMLRNWPQRSLLKPISAWSWPCEGMTEAMATAGQHVLKETHVALSKSTFGYDISRIGTPILGEE